jgi:hypothetical protein
MILQLLGRDASNTPLWIHHPLLHNPLCDLINFQQSQLSLLYFEKKKFQSRMLSLPLDQLKSRVAIAAR